MERKISKEDSTTMESNKGMRNKLPKLRNKNIQNRLTTVKDSLINQSTLKECLNINPLTPTMEIINIELPEAENKGLYSLGNKSMKSSNLSSKYYQNALTKKILKRVMFQNDHFDIFRKRDPFKYSNYNQ